MIDKVRKIVFLVIGVVTVLEFMTMQGMFTGPLVMGLSILAGLFNVAMEIRDKNVNNALLYVLATVALNMGYAKLMF